MARATLSASQPRQIRPVGRAGMVAKSGSFSTEAVTTSASLRYGETARWWCVRQANRARIGQSLSRRRPTPTPGRPPAPAACCRCPQRWSMAS
eukprot:scaffold20778_cov69-Phaeocystis_antarctica.AAC.1